MTVKNELRKEFSARVKGKVTKCYFAGKIVIFSKLSCFSLQLRNAAVERVHHRSRGQPPLSPEGLLDPGRAGLPQGPPPPVRQEGGAQRDAKGGPVLPAHHRSPQGVLEEREESRPVPGGHTVAGQEGISGERH